MATLPERLALARSESLPHADFLTLVLSDEVDRRDRTSAELGDDLFNDHVAEVRALGGGHPQG